MRCAQREEIPVENPATGEIVTTVPDLGADVVAEMATRGRAAQPEWEAYGFEGRGRVLVRAQKWLMDNAERVVETIVSETGKTYEDAQFAEIAYAGERVRLLGQRGAAGTSPTSGSSPARCWSRARSCCCATARWGSSA